MTERGKDNDKRTVFLNVIQISLILHVYGSTLRKRDLWVESTRNNDCSHECKEDKNKERTISNDNSPTLLAFLDGNNLWSYLLSRSKPEEHERVNSINIRN